MKNKTSQTLFSYWNEIRGARIAPNRFEIEPASIAGVLSETYVLEHVHTTSFRFRLAGTRICDVFGREFRDKDVQILWSSDDAETFVHLLQTVSNDAAVGVVSFEGITQVGESALFEVIALPVVHAGNTVNRILGSISAADVPPPWIGHVPIVTKHIRHVYTIQPDEKSRGAFEHDRVHTANSSRPRYKRVVSTDRASFRVYDGGRDTPVPQAPHHDPITD